MGWVSDSKISGRPRVIHMLHVINAVRSRINQNPVQKQRIVARELDITLRTMSCVFKQDLGIGAFKWQTGQCLTIALKENMKKKSRHLLSLYGKKHYKEILFTNEKNFIWRKLSISKMIEFMHGHPRKPTNWCQGSNEVIILPQWCLVGWLHLFKFLWKRALKQRWEIINRTF
jgi:hypothetical protein